LTEKMYTFKSVENDTMRISKKVIQRLDGFFDKRGVKMMYKLCVCGALIPMTENLCGSCQEKFTDKEKKRQKEYDEHVRDKKSKQFYNSTQWRQARLSVLLRDNYLCVSCKKKGKLSEATVIDHIEPIKVSWEKRLSLNNLQALCDSCHTKKTHDDKRKYASLRR